MAMQNIPKDMGALGNMPQQQDGIQQTGGGVIDLDVFMEYLSMQHNLGRDKMTSSFVADRIKEIGDGVVRESLLSQLGDRMAGGFVE